MQTFYLQYVKPACVCFLQPPIYHREKHSKTGSKNRRNCVTHSTATLSCMLSTNPRQSSFRCYAPSALRAAGDPKLTHITIHDMLNTPHSTVLFPSNGHCSKTTLRGFASADCVGLWWETAERTSFLWCAKHRPGCLHGLQHDTWINKY